MKNGLKRELGLLDVFCLASGAMISSGLFVLPGLAYAKSGPALIFAYILAGILVIPALLAKAELATAMPKAGGVYFFIERSLGTAAGTVGGMASWFSLSFKSAFALVGMGTFAVLIYPAVSPFQVKAIAVGCCLFFMIINIVGVKHTGRLQVHLVLVLFGILILYALGGGSFIHLDNFVPFMPHGLGSLFATAGLVFVSFGGLTKVACVSEEVKNPGRNIPLGMLLAFVAVMFLYVLVIFITVGLVAPDKLAATTTPISLGAGTFLGPFGVAVMALGAILAFVTTANAGILSASRDLLAISRDEILPGTFSRLNERFRTPHIPIVFTALFMIVVILFLDLEGLAKTASTLKIVLFTMVNISLIIMRESRIQNYRPRFRSPLYPWIQILAIIGYLFLLAQMGKTPLLIAGGFIAISLAWYGIYVRRSIGRFSALIHVVERLTDSKLVNDTLRSELKQILMERDGIIEDRFDSLIKKSVILDIQEPVTDDEVFAMLAETISKDLNMDETMLHELFRERERQSSTVLAPGLAVPHIVIEGSGKFDIVPVRCRPGITFSCTPDPVHILFALIGSIDERNFHLRVLSAIAQIVQDKEFDENWMKARSTEALRDILLLAERKRFTSG